MVHVDYILPEKNQDLQKYLFLLFVIQIRIIDEY